MEFIVSGLIVGFVVGVTGVGGGSLMTPLLVLLFGIQPSVAIGTDLLYAAATKTIGTFVHGFGGTIDWRVTATLAAGSVPTSLAMVALLYRFGGSPIGANSDSLLTHFLGFALLLTAVAMLARKRIQAYAASRPNRLSSSKRTALTVLTGILLGVFVSLTSVGAGALGIIALLLLYPDLPTSRLVGSDIAHAVPLALLAGLGHWAVGSILPGTLGLLLIGSIPGIIVGSLLSPRLPDQWLRLALAAVLTLVGGRLALR